MKYLILAGLLIFSGCGKDVVVQTVEKEVTKEVFLPQDFEGYWYCGNSSNVELIADYQDRITFETSGQSLNSLNPESLTEFGTHPTIGERDLILNNGKLVINPRNYNYSSSTHDIEEDVSGSNITGNHRTDIKVELKTSKELTLEIKIWSGALNTNINEIIATRTFNCTL